MAAAEAAETAGAEAAETAAATGKAKNRKGQRPQKKKSIKYCRCSKVADYFCEKGQCCDTAKVL